MYYEEVARSVTAPLPGRGAKAGGAASTTNSPLASVRAALRMRHPGSSGGGSNARSASTPEDAEEGIRRTITPTRILETHTFWGQVAYVRSTGFSLYDSEVR